MRKTGGRGPYATWTKEQKAEKREYNRQRRQSGPPAGTPPLCCCGKEMVNGGVGKGWQFCSERCRQIAIARVWRLLNQLDEVVHE